MKDTKINKQILQKESINSDGQQLYQYQQNKQSPLIPKPMNTKTTMT